VRYRQVASRNISCSQASVGAMPTIFHGSPLRGELDELVHALNEVRR